MVMRTFKYRIYPTTKQTRILESTLEDCRWLYNQLLEQRKTAWETEKKRFTYYSQGALVRPMYESNHAVDINCMVLGNVALRVDLAFKAFFRRVQNGQKPGYPRFKGIGRYNSIGFRLNSFKIVNDRKIHLSKIGDISFHYHRKLEGKPKTCAIKRTPTGKWWAFFACETEPVHISKTGQMVGIDVGLKTFAHLSDDLTIDNPKFFKWSEDKLTKVQRKFTKEPNGTKRKVKLKSSVAHIHEQITNKRIDFAHQMSRQIVDTYDIICVEDIQIQEMQKDNFKCMNRSINDVSWYQFNQFLTYKAENAGKRIVKVDPAYTSQDCSSCGNRQLIPLSQRTYSCPCCGLELDRDHNAALNILARGLASLGLSLNGTCNQAQ